MEKFYVGVDVGGTSIKMGMFSHTGELLEKWEIPTRVDEDEQTDRILPDIAASIEEKRAEKNGNIVGIGLGIPGPVTDDGTVLKCANIHWPVFNVKEKLFDLTGVANIRVGFDSIVMVTLGTGVGGGVILGGKILTGTKGAAGEIGHMTVEYDEEETCNCGTKGCLEQYASATGIVRLAKKQMVETSKAGDAYALQIVDRFARYLGVALGNVAQIIDPEAFVIGGGVARAGSIITESIEKYYNDSVMFALRGKQFNLAELGNDAGIYGAVRMVL